MKTLLNNKKFNNGFLIFSIVAFIVTLILGMIEVVTIVPRGDFFEGIWDIISGTLIAFVFLLMGATYIGYEGLDTPENMMINSWFYVFLIIMIIAIILVVRLKIKNHMKKVHK